MDDRHTFHHFLHKPDFIQKLQEDHDAAKRRQRPVRLLQQHLLPAEYPRALCFHPPSLRSPAGRTSEFRLKRMLPQSENGVLVVIIEERFWLWRVEMTW